MKLLLKFLLCVITFWVFTRYFKIYVLHRDSDTNKSKNYPIEESNVDQTKVDKNNYKMKTKDYQSTLVTENKNKANGSNHRTGYINGFTLPNFHLSINDVQPITTEFFPSNLNFLSLPANLYSDLMDSRFTHYFVPKYNLHVCRINKNAATVTHAVLCFIDNPTKYHQFFMNAYWKDGLTGTECYQSTKTATELASQPHFFEREDIRHLVIVRDPIERFVSGWQYLCVLRVQSKRKINQKARRVVAPYCFNCQDDFQCFIRKNYAYLKALSKGPNVKMEIFHDHEGYYHFYPQTWYCDLDHHLQNYNYILTYNSTRNAFANELLKFLEQIQVPEEARKKVSKVIIQTSTWHTSDKTRTKELLDEIANNRTLFDILYNTYYSDFQALKKLKVLKSIS